MRLYGLHGQRGALQVHLLGGLGCAEDAAGAALAALHWSIRVPAHRMHGQDNTLNMILTEMAMIMLGRVGIAVGSLDVRRCAWQYISHTEAAAELLYTYVVTMIAIVGSNCQWLVNA